MGERVCDLVLVPYDFSAGSSAAAHSAARDAAATGQRLLLVHVLCEDAEIDLPHTAEQDAFRGLAHMAVSLRRRHPPLAFVDVEIHRGDPVDVLQWLISTREVARVVAGFPQVHRSPPFDGAVAQRLAACATVPVILVSPAELRDGAEA